MAFASGTMPGTLENAGPSYVFSGGAVVFPGDDSQRTNLRTVADDFYSRSFVAEVTLTTGGNIAFFGMGDGSPDPTQTWEPDFPGIYLRLHPNSLAGGATNTTDNGVTTTLAEATGSGTHRLRLTWDAATQNAVFEIDRNYTGGPFVADQTSSAIYGGNNGLNDTNTRIFFGSAGNASFDDFQVTDGSLTAVNVTSATVNTPAPWH